MAANLKSIMLGIALAALTVFGGWAFLVYTPQGQQLQITFGFTDPKDCD